MRFRYFALTLGLAAGLLILALPAAARVFDAGDDFYRKKQFSQSRQAFQAITRESSDTSVSAAAQYRAALCLYDLGQYTAFQAEAEPLLKRHQEAGIEKTKFLKYRLACVPLVQENWTEAAQALSGFVKEFPRTQYTYGAVKGQAKALAKLNRHADGRQAFLDFMSKNKKSKFVENAALKAALFLKAGEDYEAFEKEGRLVLARYPGNKSMDAELIRLGLAQLPGQRGRWEESALELEKMIQAKPGIVTLTTIECGKAWLMASGTALRRGKQEEAAQRKAKGIGNLLRARGELMSELAQGKKSRSDESTRMRILETYYLEQNYAGLIEAANLLTAEVQPPSRLWAKAMIFKGVACLNKAPRDLDGAAAAFDAVIAANVQDDSRNEHIPTLALYWRMTVAREKQDNAGVQTLLGQLASMPEGPYKRSALAKSKKPPE